MNASLHTRSRQALSYVPAGLWTMPIHCIASGSLLRVLAFLSPGQLQAATTCVIRTDSGPLPEPYLVGIGAAHGLLTPGFVFLDPSSGGSIAGVPQVFGGVLNASSEFDHTARFEIAGDLNLGAGDAVIAAGARISVAAVGRFPGAGGGAGGARRVMPTNAASYLDVMGGTS